MQHGLYDMLQMCLGEYICDAHKIVNVDMNVSDSLIGVLEGDHCVHHFFFQGVWQQCLAILN